MAAVALMMWLTCIRNQGLHDHYTHQQGATRKSTFYAASIHPGGGCSIFGVCGSMNPCIQLLRWGYHASP
jgi:hypothetical protein